MTKLANAHAVLVQCARSGGLDLAGDTPSFEVADKHLQGAAIRFVAELARAHPSIIDFRADAIACLKPIAKPCCPRDTDGDGDCPQHPPPRYLGTSPRPTPGAVVFPPASDHVAAVGPLPVSVLEECLDAMLVRARWYEARNKDTPDRTLHAYPFATQEELSDGLDQRSTHETGRLDRRQPEEVPRDVSIPTPSHRSGQPAATNDLRAQRSDVRLRARGTFLRNLSRPVQEVPTKREIVRGRQPDKHGTLSALQHLCRKLGKNPEELP